MNLEDSAHVLYVDHKGHPAPLSLCYHATASRRLASAVERHPPSTITEVDSAFCPQCLSFHDVTSATSLGFCPKASCRLCPLCASVASIGIDGTSSECLYKCGLCDWTSRECQLVSVVAADASPEDIARASEDILAQYQARVSQRDQAAGDHYNGMLKALEGVAKEQVKGQRSTFSWLPNANVRRKDAPEGWSIDALEDSLKARKKLALASLSETVGGQNLQSSSLLVDQPLDESLDGKSTETLLLQGGSNHSMSLSQLLPLPVPLRPRKSRRCRAELRDGRPGILLKPKLNPLEGDSSLRSGHSQWWKKDSSAVQVLPRVRVSSHKSDETRHVFLLKVINPTLGAIRMRLASSSYTGEPTWDEGDGTTVHLQNLLVDPFSDQHTNAELFPNIMQGLTETEICELQPAEDSFLELGKLANEVPDAVKNWQLSDALSNSSVSKDGPASSLNLIASRNSIAWYELVVLECRPLNGIDSAITLSMQIEIGSGSWDSSLIQPEPRQDGDVSLDFASFDLVLVWENIEK